MLMSLGVAMNGHSLFIRIVHIFVAEDNIHSMTLQLCVISTTPPRQTYVLINLLFVTLN